MVSGAALKRYSSWLTAFLSLERDAIAPRRYRNFRFYSARQPDDVPVCQSNTAVAHTMPDPIRLVGAVNTDPTFI
jgi:hypothetical protein